MEFINDGIAAGVARPSLRANRFRFLLRKPTERGTTVCRTWLRASLTIEVRREKDRGRVRVKQHFFGMKTVSAFGFMRPFDAVRIEHGAAELAGRNAAMPDASGLMSGILKAKLKNRVNRILLFITEQSHRGGMPGIKCEVECLLRLHPTYSQRPWVPGGN